MIILIVGIYLSAPINIHRPEPVNASGYQALCDDYAYEKQHTEETKGCLEDVVPSSSACGKIIPASKKTPFLTDDYDIK